jgi:ketol-acid reductoisomerase
MKIAESGLKVSTAKDAAREADVVMILVIDEKQAALYSGSIVEG